MCKRSSDVTAYSLQKDARGRKVNSVQQKNYPKLRKPEGTKTERDEQFLALRT